MTSVSCIETLITSASCIETLMTSASGTQALNQQQPRPSASRPYDLIQRFLSFQPAVFKTSSNLDFWHPPCQLALIISVPS